MKLYDYVKMNGGLDICDDTWDWGTYIDFDESNEPYDMFIAFMAKDVELIKVNANWYSPCKVCEFVVKYKSAFKKFFNEENREGYRPMDYENGDDQTCDEGFFEAYMEGLESLINGNYCDEDYKKLLKYLTK